MATYYPNKYNGDILLNTNRSSNDGILDNNNKYLLYMTCPDSSTLKSFYKINYETDLGYTENLCHYIMINELNTDSSGVVTSYNIVSDKKILWCYGNTTYNHRLNYNLTDGYLYNLNDTTTDNITFNDHISHIIQNQHYIQCELYLPQGYDWSNMYGIRLIVKGSTTNNIYYSEMLSTLDFTISETRHLLYGSFWVESYKLYLPLVSDEDFLISIIETNIDEVSNTGLVSAWQNSTDSFQSLIQNQPYPDYITTTLSLDDRYFLKLSTQTTESKTLQRSILDYFQYSESSIVPITITYLIYYSDQIISVSNQLNTFDPITIGLDLFSYFYDTETSTIVHDSLLIDVTTEIKVDSKTMTRESDTLTIEYSDILTSVQSAFASVAFTQYAPQTINIQNVDKSQTINTNIIQKSVETKVVQIYQNVFIELVDTDFKYERKNVSFHNINRESYMLIYSTKETSIYSSVTSDGIYYFDMTIITPLTKDTSYEIYSADSNIMLGKGIITV